MNGRVQSGVADALPLANARVGLLEAVNGTWRYSNGGLSDADGEFSFDTPVTRSSGIYYITADIGDGVLLLALLGELVPPRVVLNELTTVAGSYCAAQFISGASDGGVQITGDSFGLKIAAIMNTNFVDVTTGQSTSVLSTSPNGDQTNAMRSFHSLANFFSACVRMRDPVLKLFWKLTVDLDGDVAPNTVQGLSNVARDPANQVGGIYLQSKLMPTFTPALESQPDAWTLVVKVNDSGSTEHMFGGPGNIAFDAQGRGWIANNVVQGSGTSTEWSIVLSADGRPARREDGSLMSPFTGGGLLGPGFGVDVDSNGCAWFGDFGWGKDNPAGSVSLFDPNAKPISPAPDGYTDGGVNRVQGVTVDEKTGNVWFASWGNGLVVMYPNGDHTKAVCYPSNGVAPANCNPFDVAIAADGSAWVTNSNADASSVFHLSYTNGALQLLSETKIGKVMKGIDIDSNGVIWTGSGGDDHVYAFDSNGVLIGGYQGGGINGPWGLTLDGNDNVWVANFGPLAVGSVFTGRVTQLAGANANTRPKNRLTGDALSPQTGYTLPSAGDPVLLNNLDPLYGPGAPPSYIPMMRTTGINIDAAGNVWTCNNWKPSFDIDLFGEPFNDVAANPGGDGMLIWVGLAKPRG